jgi:formylmethanofuran dehydrogenase subunit C
MSIMDSNVELPDRASYLSSITRGTVWEDETIVAVGGGASVVVNGDVYGNIRCEGGAAEVIVNGDIRPNAHIICRGGAATVQYSGSLSSAACVEVIGGGARLVRMEQSSFRPGHFINGTEVTI